MNNEKRKFLYESKNKSNYTADESKEGQCPICGSGEIEYGTSENEGTHIEYPWECKKCGSEGVEFGVISFHGHRVDSSPFMENENSESCEESNDETESIKYNIIADDGTYLAQILSKFIVGDTMYFYQNYEAETNYTDGAYGVTMINKFDSEILFFNYGGGGQPYVIDVTSVETEYRFEYIKDYIHNYFNVIGFHQIYICVKN